MKERGVAPVLIVLLVVGLIGAGVGAYAISQSVQQGGQQGGQQPEEPTEEQAPAEFEVSNLSISPSEVEPGQRVTVSAIIKNTGGVSGTKTVEFNVDGETKMKDVTLESGESENVSISITKQEEGMFNVRISEMTGSFKVLTPAKFKVSSVSKSGNSIVATITNSGDLVGVENVSLKVDDKLITTKAVSIKGGQVENVSFNVSLNLESYKIRKAESNFLELSLQTAKTYYEKVPHKKLHTLTYRVSSSEPTLKATHVVTAVQNTDNYPGEFIVKVDYETHTGTKGNYYWDLWLEPGETWHKTVKDIYDSWKVEVTPETITLTQYEKVEKMKTEIQTRIIEVLIEGKSTGPTLEENEETQPKENKENLLYEQTFDINENIIQSVKITVNNDNWESNVTYSVPAKGTWYIYDIDKNLVHTYTFPSYSTNEGGTWGEYIPAGEDGYIQLKATSGDGQVEWWPSEDNLYKVDR